MGRRGKCWALVLLLPRGPKVGARAGPGLRWEGCRGLEGWRWAAGCVARPAGRKGQRGRPSGPIEKRGAKLGRRGRKRRWVAGPRKKKRFSPFKILRNFLGDVEKDSIGIWGEIQRRKLREGRREIERDWHRKEKGFFLLVTQRDCYGCALQTPANSKPRTNSRTQVLAYDQFYMNAPFSQQPLLDFIYV